MGQQFIGVYATSETAPYLGDYPRPAGKRKRLWFVWETPEGRYKVQALNAAHQPMAEPRTISVREFEDRFTLEEGCVAAPEGYVSPSAAPVDAAREQLPDLFTAIAEPAHVSGGAPSFPAGLSLATPVDDGQLRSDDPNLLFMWAKEYPPRNRAASDFARIPFDRLVNEVMETPDMPGAAGNAPERASEFAISEEPESSDEVELVRTLRSRFVQALLVLRRGERDESIAMLRDILEQPYADFAGGAQLFSEFGLGLRRLGLIFLALAAHKRALEFAPDNPRVLFNIARGYHDLGLLTEAREFLSQALAIAPDFAAARQFLEFLEAGPVRDAGNRP